MWCSKSENDLDLGSWERKRSSHRSRCEMTGSGKQPVWEVLWGHWHGESFQPKEKKIASSNITDLNFKFCPIIVQMYSIWKPEI